MKVYPIYLPPPPPPTLLTTLHSHLHSEPTFPKHTFRFVFLFSQESRKQQERKVEYSKAEQRNQEINKKKNNNNNNKMESGNIGEEK